MIKNILLQSSFASARRAGAQRTASGLALLPRSAFVCGTLAGFLLVSASAQAATLSYTGPDGGDFLTAANYTVTNGTDADGVPDADDLVEFGASIAAPSAINAGTVNVAGTAPVLGIRFTSNSTGFAITGAASASTIANVAVTNAGTGFTGVPTVSFTGGGGSGATATANLKVVSAAITSGGTGYTNNSAVTFTGGGGSGATGTAIVTNGAVTGVTITAGGSGYTSPPTAVFTGGTGAAGNGVLGINTITVNNGGSGFTSAPTVTLTGGGGSGFAATAVTLLINRLVVGASGISSDGTGAITNTISAPIEAAASQSFTVASGNTLRLSGVLSGSTNSNQTFTKSSPGTLEFATTGSLTSNAASGNNTFRVNGGTVTLIGSKGPFGGSNTRVFLTLDAGTFDLNGNSLAPAPTGGATTPGLGTFAGTGGILTNSSATSADFVFSQQTATATTFGGTITGNLNFGLNASNGNSLFNLTNAANSYTGITRINSNIIVRAGGNSPSGGPGIFGSSTSAIELAGNNQNKSLLIDGAFTIGRDISSLATGTGTNTLGNNSAVTSAFTGTINLGKNLILSSFAGGTVNYAGKITGVGGISLATGGVNLLSNPANDYSGGTTVPSSQTLALGADNVLGSGTLSVTGNVRSDGATARSQSNPLALTGAATFGTGAAQGALTFGGNVTLGAARTITTTAPTTFNGSITDAFALTKAGAASLTLGGTASNAQTTTTVTVGTLILNKTGGAIAIAGALNVGDGTGTDVVQLAGDNQIADSSALSLNSGTFNTGGFSDSLGALNIPDGAASSLNLGNGASVLTFSSFGAGTGTLSVVGFSGSSSGGGTDRLIIGGPALTASQLAQISFVNPNGTSTTLPAQQLSSGEVVPVFPLATSGAIISEFRFRGATGTADEFVEIFNTLGTPLNISGWSIQTNTAINGGAGLQTTLVPANTTIPARGHFLFTGTGYSLSTYGAGNASITSDAADDSGVALFNAAGGVQDAVGFISSDSTLKEGLGLASAPNVNGEYAFLRDFNNSLPKDSGDSTADFVFISTNASAGFDQSAGTFGTPVTVAGTNGAVAAQLGAPSPEGLGSPVYVNDQVTNSLLDPGVSQGAAPNRVRTSSGNDGTLVVRRTLKNNTNRALTRVRFMVTRITADGSALTAGQTRTSQAIIRLTNSPDEPNVLLSDGVTSVAVSGTTFEANAAGLPTQPLGGGLGSSVSFNAVLSTPLAPSGTAGDTRAYAFTFNIVKSGNFTAILNIEALPAP